MASLWDRAMAASGPPKRKKKKSKPKPPPRPASNPVARAARQVSRAATSGAARTAEGAGRASVTASRAARSGSPVRKGPKKQKLDSDAARFLARVEDYERRRAQGPIRVEPSRGVEASGFGVPADLLRNRRGPSGGLSGLVSNFGGDVIDVITGVPSAVQLGAQAGFYPIALGLEATGGLEDDSVTAGIERNLRTAGVAFKDDLGTRYGPAVRALGEMASLQGSGSEDWAEFGRQAYQHPGLLALDAAAAWSGAGVGVRLGAKAGAGLTRGATSARLARTGSRAVTPGSARYRAPRVRTMEMGENTAMGARGRSLARVETPRRPYSANPLTRSIQRGSEGVAGRISQRVQRAADNDNPLFRGFSTQSRFNRDVARSARDRRLEADLAMERTVRMETQDYARALRDLDRSGLSDLARRGSGKWSRDQVDAALYLHGRDLLDVPGMTPAQARNRVVQYMREGLDEAVQKGGVKSKGAQATIEAIAKVPDELLDLKTAPPQFRRALSEYRRIAEQATDWRVRSGSIKPETAEAVRRRPAQAVHEGIRFETKTGEWTSPRNPYTPVGKRGVYTPDIPVDRLKGGKQPGDVTGAMGRMTQDRVRQSHGTLFRQGNVKIDRGLPVKALERAVVDKNHPGFVSDFFDTFAFRRPNGDLSRGKRAIMAMEADPENVVLVSGKSLRDAMRLSDDLPEGALPDNPLDNLVTFEGRGGVSSAQALDKVKRKDLVAFPKAAIEGMRQGWDGIKGGRMGWFDTPQAYWKRGILAFAPRWYVNSLFGNTLQYGLLTGGDIRSIMQARRSRIGNVVPERVTGSTNVAELRVTDPARGPRTKVGRGVTKASDVGMNFQHKLDGLFRRAAYINRMKRGLRDEGGRFRRLTDDELIRAIDEAPAEVKNQALRETELFMGDYLRMSPMERATLRRVFPFYSWMRVIGKFMAVVPIRHPKRVALTAMVSRAAAEAVNPEDQLQRILANRGRVKGGGFAMRTAGANPFFTHADLLKNAAGRDWQGAAGSLASNLSPVGLQQAARTYSGTTPFGTPVSYPAGYGGTASQFGRSTMRLDPVTGLPDYYEPSVPWSEQLLQSIPLGPQLVRGIASGGRSPYDVTTTAEILAGGDPGELFMPDRDRAMESIPYLGPVLGWSGFNVQRYDSAQERTDYRRLIRDWRNAQKQTRRRQRKAR